MTAGRPPAQLTRLPGRPPARLTRLPGLLGLLLGLGLGLEVGLGTGAPPARADCGGVQIARPHTRPATYLPPLALGDSTMIFALPGLAAEGYTANARGCRQFPEAIALLARLRHAHSLPHLVVVALGANGSVTDADVRAALAVLGHRRQLALVTPREDGGGAGSDAVTVRAEARRHPDQVHALDWISYSASQASWFAPDRLHLTFTGAAAFARLLGRALPLAVPPGHGRGPTGKPPPARPVGSPTPVPPLSRPAPTRTPKPTPTTTCPTRAPGPPPAAPADATPTTPQLQPADPLVTISAAPTAGGTLRTEAGGQTVSVELDNRNPFALTGSLRIVPTAPSQAAAATTVCLDLRPVASSTVAFKLAGSLARLLDLDQRIPVRLTATLYDQAGHQATVTGLYLLTRPPRGPAGARPSTAAATASSLR